MEALKVTELKQLAKEKKIVGYSKMKKAELIEALNNQEDSLLTICENEKRKDVVEMAKAFGVKTKNKTQRQICSEILTHQTKSPQKSPKKPTPKSPSKLKPKPKTCESQLRADIIEQAKKLGIAIGKKTKAQLCHEINELTDSEFSESSDDSYYIMDRSMQTSLEQDKWLDIVEKLTDTSYTRFTPDELAAIVKKQDLLKYARSMGLKVTGMSAIGIANAIYEDTKSHKDF